jgi:hypothetical protein
VYSKRRDVVLCPKLVKRAIVSLSPLRFVCPGDLAVSYVL